MLRPGFSHPFAYPALQKAPTPEKKGPAGRLNARHAEQNGATAEKKGATAVLRGAAAEQKAARAQ
jgi:hypothetical protein